MPLAPGTRFGAYEVVALIGAGGMGEVYRARDLKLNRDVAVKILPDLVAADPDRLARFRREAQIVASLNQPNIAHVYGLEEVVGTGPLETRPPALVMELVEGPTLADRIADGPMPASDALAIANQIADALEAAHERGIVHRDLKPGNIKVCPDGTVKVLDFGLAKMLERDVPGAGGTGTNLSMSPTLSVHATYAGVILGTAAYMSPEQARGRAVDKRTDVWALGCVVFEMLSGVRAFEGEDIAETIGAVIHKEPVWDTLPANTPAMIRLVLQRCLEKDPKRRLRDIADVRLALAGAFELPPSATTAATLAPRQTKGRSIVIAATAATTAAVIAAGISWWLLRPTPATHQPMRFTIAPPAAQPLNLQGFFRQIAISPDGSRIAYIAGSDSQLMIRAIDQLDAVSLGGAIGGFPFFSPDGRWIGIFSQGSGGELKKVPAAGGPAATICRYQGTPRGGTWGPDDTIVFATNDVRTGLLSVPAAGGEPKVLTTPDPAEGEQDHWMPSLAPDGRTVFFTISSAAGEDHGQVAMFDLRSGQRKTLIRGGNDAAYVAAPTGSGQPGYLVYGFAGGLRAVGFDLQRSSVLSDPISVVEGIAMMQTGASDFGISRQGTLIYVPGGSSGRTARSLVWVSRDGYEEPMDLPARPYTYARVSPDGTRVAVAISDQENDIWIHDVGRRTTTRLTFDANLDNAPVWSPDGRRIVFASSRAGPANIFAQSADGTGTVDRLTTSPNAQSLGSFSPDGRALVFQESNAATGTDLMLLRFDPAPRVEPLLQTSFAEASGEISPDGRWIAYYSIESGTSQVFVRPFPKVDGGRWQISTGGGSRPAWSKNGNELVYMGPSSAMMAVPVRTAGTFIPGNPTKLFDGVWYNVQNIRPYDVSRDGKKFLMIKNRSAEDPRMASPTITVVVNWVDELTARVSKGK